MYFDSYLRGRVFVAFNAQFDLKFTKKECERSGEYLEDEISICALKLAKRIVHGDLLKKIGAVTDTGKGSYKQTHLCTLYGVPLPNAHRADGSNNIYFFSFKL